VRLAGTADDEDVLRLDVAVHDAAAVRPVQRPGDLLDDAQRLRRVERPAVLEQRGEVGVAQRRRDVEVLALGAVVPDREHVWVVGALGGLRLALEARAELEVAREPP